MASLKLVPAQKRSDRTDSESTPTPLEKSLHVPKFVETMQPILVEHAPEGTGWLHEIKYDGYRTQLALGDVGPRAYSRSGLDWTSKYGNLIEDAKAIRCRSALIDGEVCVQDDRGVTDFGLLPGAIRKSPGKLVFFAFDLLHLDGEDLRARPLEAGEIALVAAGRARADPVERRIRRRRRRVLRPRRPAGPRRYRQQAEGQSVLER